MYNQRELVSQPQRVRGCFGSSNIENTVVPLGKTLHPPYLCVMVVVLWVARVQISSLASVRLHQTVARIVAYPSECMNKGYNFEELDTSDRLIKHKTCVSH